MDRIDGHVYDILPNGSYGILSVTRLPIRSSNGREDEE